MSIEKKLFGTSPSGDAPNVEDVFSTYLYDGNSSTQTITNDIDLAGEGGMVWMKCRDNGYDHQIYDTERGVTNHLRSNTTEAEGTQSTSLTSFNSDGFTIGSLGWINFLDNDFASWTFRKAERFFDVVTYTGNGVSGREIAHDLGVAPGMIIVKRTDSAESWVVFHKTQGVAYAELESTGAFYSGDVRWGSQLHSTTHFSLDDHAAVNVNGASYVAYLFAHDPDGENDDGMIACGSYTGSGSAGNFVDLGWEPQYIMIKNASSAWQWIVFDTMRGITSGTGSADKYLTPNSGAVEGSQEFIEVNSQGFTLTIANAITNTSGDTYIYMAIRAPMMKEPEAGTEVFAIDQGDGSGSSTVKEYYAGFPVDLAITHDTTGSNHNTLSRITGAGQVRTNSSDAEQDTGVNEFDSNDSYHRGAQSSIYYAHMFKRAKGFFDVVADTGNGVSGLTVNHSLGVVPEMMIRKSRSSSHGWIVYTTSMTADNHSKLNENYASNPGTSMWNDTEPTDLVFSVGTGSETNANGTDYITYLFATLAGVSKVGSYTGNGSSQNIACGFSGGARFVLIKRTDTNGDWYMWDTERGIVSGNDPHLSLNNYTAEVTSDDSIDPQSAGFTVNQVSATNINVTNGTYIFLAIA